MTLTFPNFENYVQNTTFSLSPMKSKLELQERGNFSAWNIGTSNPTSFSLAKQSQGVFTLSAPSSQIETLCYILNLEHMDQRTAETLLPVQWQLLHFKLLGMRT